MFPFSTSKKLIQSGIAGQSAHQHEGSGHELVTFDKEKINLFAAEVRFCEPHWHSASEFIYVLQGSFAITIDNRTIKLAAGGMLYINQDRIHSLEATEQHSSLLTVQFAPNLFDELHHELLIDYCIENASKYCSKDIQVKNDLIKLVKHQLQYSHLASFRKIALIYMLLSSLENAGKAADNINTLSVRKKDELLIKECIEYINTHYSSELKLSHIASQANISYHYFSKLFKKVNGCNFKEYLTYVRINRAKFLLKNTQKPITEISYDCGFSEHKHLISAFKKYCAMTPTEYRKQYVSKMNMDYNNAGTDFNCLEWTPEILNMMTAH